MSKLTHLSETGEARMADISDKQVSAREAVARAQIRMNSSTLDLIASASMPKGDVLAAARIAGIQAAKRTSELIPLCHPLPLTKVELTFERVDDSMLHVEARCKVTGQTGVEMEALTAASVASLTIYDMCKSVEKGIVIQDIRLLSKSGGKSGDWVAEDS